MQKKMSSVKSLPCPSSCFETSQWNYTCFHPRLSSICRCSTAAVVMHIRSRVNTYSHVNIYSRARRFSDAAAATILQMILRFMLITLSTSSTRRYHHRTCGSAHARSQTYKYSHTRAHARALARTLARTHTRSVPGKQSKSCLIFTSHTTRPCVSPSLFFVLHRSAASCRKHLVHISR
jgi:hypothetical protein